MTKRPTTGMNAKAYIELLGLVVWLGRVPAGCGFGCGRVLACEPGAIDAVASGSYTTMQLGQTECSMMQNHRSPRIANWYTTHLCIKLTLPFSAVTATSPPVPDLCVGQLGRDSCFLTDGLLSCFSGNPPAHWRVSRYRPGSPAEDAGSWGLARRPRARGWCMPLPAAVRA